MIARPRPTIRERVGHQVDIIVLAGELCDVIGVERQARRIVVTARLIVIELPSVYTRRLVEAFTPSTDALMVTSPA